MANFSTPILSSYTIFSPACAFPVLNHRRKLSCRAANGDREGSKDSGAAPGRRNLLIGLGGLYGAAATAAGLSTDLNAAFAAPIQPPVDCGPATDVPSGVSPPNCCPPVSTSIDFRFPSRSSPLRVRPAAHLVDADYLAKYTKAVQLMKDLPASDPRNFTQQANVHCAYCDGAYDQAGFPDLELQIHSSWLFFPWHRCYLYFHERILGKLIGDDSFALPFWNWDAPAGMQIPAIYTTSSSSLYDPRRDPSHQPPVIADLDFSLGQPTGSGQALIDDNLKIMYRQLMNKRARPELFMGAAYRAGDNPNPGAGSLENVPHNTMHIWTGDSRQPNREDMGVLFSAARDPIFYAHHSNIDRLWEVWKTLGGRVFTDSDWLNAGFLFYDENAQLVKVKVSDCVDTEKLRYTYQKIENPWINAKPAPAGTGKGVAPKVEPTFPVTLDKANVVASAKRPARSGRSGDEEEVLVVEGIEYQQDAYIKFDVYVNASAAAVLRPAVSECAGSFVHVPHAHGKGRKGATAGKSTLKLGIANLIAEIGAAADDSLVVTLVPRIGTAKVAGLSIVLLS
ncbi:Polyphenol oxidase, chloroplastic [Apostasia shenzhenica]|uniref:Polyphenol oxidase, chloroplastic n=1 Tax=Apostasia shenzhenica TaxID=1088818 RepID=A0A2I0ADC5_9ASPA|nr:Polyphenol oxidase, chloroplastic [Apostasia shenzhenica]